MTEHCLILITTPDNETANSIAHHLVENQLAACVNILPGLTSIYTWEDQVNADAEILLIVKTRLALVDEHVVPTVESLHPYDVPEVIALPIEKGNINYLRWIADETIDPTK